MTDHPVTTPEPWPGWLADLTPEDRVTAIVSAVVNCYRLGQRGHESADPGEQHCTATMAHAFLLRLLGEARQQAPSQSADAHAYLSTSCLHASEPGREHLHGYCQSATGFVAGVATWPKTPAVCKFCQSPCRCGCHSGEPVAAAAEPVSFAAALELRSQIADALGGFLDLEQATIAADSVMVVVVPALRRQQAPVRPESLATDRLTVAVAALHRLALPDMLLRGAEGCADELKARREHASEALETITRMGEMPGPEQPEPLTHFTTAGQSRLAADNFPACKALHWAIVSPYVRQVTCPDCQAWLGSAVANLTRALANAASTIERRDAELGEPDPEPLPPGFFGRVELPGFRNYTGWITQDGADRIVSDWDGNVLAEYQPGPNCLTIHLPTPQKRPEPQKAIAASSRYGDYEPDDDDPWGSDGDDG